MQKELIRKRNPVADDIESLKSQIDKCCRFIITSQCDEAQECIIANIYKAEDKNVVLRYRILQKKDDYCTWDEEGKKWRSGSIENIDAMVSLSSYYNTTEEIGCKEQDRMIQGWISKDYGSFIKNLIHLQINVLNARRIKKHRKELDEIDMQMMKFENLPDDYQEFVHNTVFSDEKYIFYDKKKGIAKCNHCNSEFRIDRKNASIKHNGKGVCEKCGKELTYKSSGKGKKNLMKAKWSVIVQSRGNEILVRYFRHIKQFTDDCSEQYETDELYRTVHNKLKSDDFRFGRFKNTDLIRWTKDPGYYPYYWSASEMMVPCKSTYLYNRDLKKELNTTDMKYSCLDMYVRRKMKEDGTIGCWMIDKYLNYYRKYPWIEQLIKVGLFDMAIDYQNHSNRNDIEHKRTLHESLGISRNAYKTMRKMNLCNWKYVELQKEALSQLKRELSESEMEMLFSERFRYKEKRIVGFMKYASLKKITGYLSKVSIDDWMDYMNWNEKLEYDLSNEFTVFPKNFKAVHDERYQEYLEKKEPEKYKTLQIANQIIESKKEEMEKISSGLDDEELFIRLPNNVNELTEEGENLHHCVGTYKERIAKGETMIFFIRKVKEPDKSFYTLEWNNNKVVQCRGMRNCGMTKEVERFVTEFSKKMTATVC